MSESAAIIRTARIRDGDALPITSLREGVRAHLIARGWDGVGYWRWAATRNGRRVKAYFVVGQTGVAQRVYGYDLPEVFRPLAPLKRGTVAGVQRPPDDDAEDMDTALRELEARMLLAIKIDNAEPDPTRRLLRVKTTNYQTSAAPGDYPTGISTRFTPTPAQRSDAFIVLAWIAALELSQPKPFAALRYKALGYSTRTIAERMNTDGKKVRRLINGAVIACWRHAKAADQNAGKEPGKRARARW